MRATLLVVVVVVLAVPAMALETSQSQAAWRDPSPHHVRWITVDSSVRLEVLDWEGSGPPLVLLERVAACLKENRIEVPASGAER